MRSTDFILAPLFDRLTRICEELKDLTKLVINHDDRLTSNNPCTSIEIFGKAKGETVPS
jgi:hypothetical protein